MHPFGVMAEPIRRRLIDVLASGAHYAGDLEDVITSEFGVGRSAVQHHLKLLRSHHFVTVHDEWPFRAYQLEETLIRELRALMDELDYKWQRRIGFRETTDLLFDHPGSRRGMRGRGNDPDGPWRHHATAP